MRPSIFSPKQLQLLTWSFPVAIALGLTIANPASACKPAPDSRPAAIEQRVDRAPYVFEGLVERVEGETLTLRVNRYFKGQGPQTLRLNGFNLTSCQDSIPEPGGRYLFFSERGRGNTWTAVYDGAFGSSKPWSAEVESELQRLGLLQQPSNPPSQTRRLPPAIATAVQRDAARRTRLPLASIRIIAAEQRTWPDACLGVSVRDRLCAQVIIEGWVVTVRAGNQTLVYHTDNTRNIVYVADTPPAGELPQIVAERVKGQASQLTNIPIERLRIIQSERQTWPNGCLGLNLIDRACTLAQVEGWRVALQSGNQQLIYRTDSSGDVVLLENGASVLPASVREAVLAAAQRQTGLPRDRFRITRASPEVWDGCFGIYERPDQACTKIAIPGWQVLVEARNNRLVYHTNQNGSDTRLNRPASQISGNNSAVNPVPLSQNELPSPLPANAVFRTIAGGGIAGDVQEVILWRDGRISSQSSRFGSTRPRWVAMQQVRDFERVLQQQRFGQYDRLQFPPPPGSADMISVTASARQGTTRYADYQVERLPQSLRATLDAWQKLLGSAREQVSSDAGADSGGDVGSGPKGGYPWLVERILFEWLGPLF